MKQLALVLRIASTIACGIVLISFAAWATDETKVASDAQAAQVDAQTGSAPAEAPVAPAPEPEHGGIRGKIDNANEHLVEPFDSLVDSTNGWVQHGIPALLALLTYGVLCRLLIAYLPR